MALNASAIESAIKAALPFERNSHYRGDIMAVAVAGGVVDVFTGSAIIIVNSGGGSSYLIEGVEPAPLESAINGYLTITLSGSHAKGGILSKAVAKGIVAAISESMVAVPSMTGGAFPVNGFLSETIISVTQAALESNGIKTTSAYARIMDMVKAIGIGTASAVSSNAIFNADGVGGGVFVME